MYVLGIVYALMNYEMLVGIDIKYIFFRDAEISV